MPERLTLKEIRIGIIGMGKMGLLHSAIINALEDSKVVAFTDSEKLVTGLLRNLSNIPTYDNYEEMINSVKMDAVYITTPVRSHIPIAKFCADNKIHFFVEKPLGVNSAECEVLCDMVNRNNIWSMVGYYLRYAETFSKVKELLDQEIVGRIDRVRSTVFQSQQLRKSSGWRFDKKISGGGVLIDLGSHLIDLLLWYFGDIRNVNGRIESNYNQTVEDTAHADLEFESGLKCSFDASWNVENYRLQETTIEIEGNSGKIRVNEDYIEIINPEQSKRLRTYRQELYQGVPVDIGGPEYTREDYDFVNCIRRNIQPMLNVTSSLQTQRVIDLIYKSANYHKVLKQENE